MSFKSWKLSNSALNLHGKNVLVVGGTQGIGAGVAIRFAQIGASVAIAGRNETLGNQVVDQMKNESKGNEEFKFFHVDASSIKDTDRFTKEVKEYFSNKGGLHYLIQTQAALNGAAREDTSEGLDRHFATALLSKWLITFNLLPILKESSIWILNPGTSGKLNLEDPELRHGYSLLKAGERDSVYLDSMTKEFQKRKSDVRFYHIFPGIVKTNIMSNSGFGSVIVTLTNVLFKAVGRDPVAYADHPVYLATSHQMGGLRFNEKGKQFKDYPWVENDENTEKLWEWNKQKVSEYVNID